MEHTLKARGYIFPTTDRARPLSLREVLRLRDGMSLARALACRADFSGNRSFRPKAWAILSLN
jgi:hypothetical protein